LANDCPFVRKLEKEQSVINSKLPFFVVEKRFHFRKEKELLCSTINVLVALLISITKITTNLRQKIIIWESIIYSFTAWKQ